MNYFANNKDRNRFFNFPVTMLQGFMDDTFAVLSEARKFACGALYVSQELKHMPPDAVTDYFGVTDDDLLLNEDTPESYIDVCKTVYYQHYNPVKKPSMTGCSLAQFRAASDPNCTEYYKILLLAYMAVKSCVEANAYWKMNYKMLFARMNGYETIIEYLQNGGDAQIEKYHTEDRGHTLRENLFNEYHVADFSKSGMRGFYMSLKLSSVKLKEIVENKKKAKNKTEKRQKFKERFKEAKPVQSFSIRSEMAKIPDDYVKQECEELRQQMPTTDPTFEEKNLTIAEEIERNIRLYNVPF